MPWLSDSPTGDGSGRVWHTALKNALLRRLQADDILGLVDELVRKHPISGDELANVLMGFRGTRKGSDDPLIFSYATLLLRRHCLSAQDLLAALLKTSKYLQTTNSGQHESTKQGLPSCEERVFNLITQLFMDGVLKARDEDPHSLLNVLAHWLHAVGEYETGKQLEGGNMHTLDMCAVGTYEALASLAFTVLSDRALRQVTKLSWWKKRRPMVVIEMENFDTRVLMWMGSQLAGRLRALTSMPPFMECDKDGRPIFRDQQILNAIPDLPTQTTRAGLYIWLNACLIARPLTDDMSILGHLQARYSGDNQSAAIGLVQASFDVLTNSILHKDSDHDIKVIRSFICNKVPILLSSLGSFMMAPASIEACIQAAFESITMDAVPPITAGSSEGRDKLKLARREFLQAAALQGLLSEQAMAAILMEPSISTPRATRYTREGLAAQCSNNIGRLEHFIEELDGMVGNAGAISGCIIDVISNLCSNKDTMSLKSVCNMLVKKAGAMDNILQYTQPANLLMPLCDQLNNWTHDQEQTEFTTAYEEFASILLLILTVVHRYGLERAEIGLSAENNFVAQYLRDMAVSKKAGDLDSEQSSQLSRWVEGLFAADDSDETSGISDEVMRQCPPQSFYHLVPTLFEQSVLACKSNTLTMKLFKGGIELLLEPFLLPCLVGGLSWLTKHSWEDHGDADVLLQALDKLLRQNSASQDAKSMHKAVMGIVADGIYKTLEVLISRKPNQRTEKQVNSLLEMLKPHRGHRRALQCSKTELSAWAASESGGLTEQLKTASQEQITWASNIGPTPPAKYTHRLIAAATAINGVDTVLDVLIAELKEQTTIGNGPAALDVCSAMICAPTSSASSFSSLSGPAPSVQTQLSPADALRLRTSNAQDLLKMPSSTAQALVRLNRAVETQLSVTPMAQLPMPSMPMQSETADQVMAELGLTDDTGPSMSMDQSGQLGGAAGANFTNADIEAALNDPGMDLGGSGGGGGGQVGSVPGMPNDPSGQQQQQQQRQSNTDDLFAGLDMDLSQPVGGGTGDVGSNGNNEEDIFAGLSMDLGDDFVDFS